MAEETGITFYADTEIKALLRKWAAEDDRSVSYIVRQCIETERLRRKQDASNRTNHKAPEKVLIAAT